MLNGPERLRQTNGSWRSCDFSRPSPVWENFRYKYSMYYFPFGHSPDKYWIRPSGRLPTVVLVVGLSLFSLFLSFFSHLASLSSLRERSAAEPPVPKRWKDTFPAQPAWPLEGREKPTKALQRAHNATRRWACALAYRVNLSLRATNECLMFVQQIDCGSVPYENNKTMAHSGAYVDWKRGLQQSSLIKALVHRYMCYFSSPLCLFIPSFIDHIFIYLPTPKNAYLPCIVATAQMLPPRTVPIGSNY